MKPWIPILILLSVSLPYALGADGDSIEIPKEPGSIQTAPSPTPAAKTSSAPASATDQPSTFKDGFNKDVRIPQVGSTTAVLGCTEDTQKACRIATRTLDEMRGIKNFKVMVVVDLRSSLGGFFPGFVRDRMQSDLKTEAARLRPYYLKNGNHGDPLDDVCAIPDFDGKAALAAGWSKPLKKLCAVIYNAQGKEIRRWEDLENFQEFEQTVRQALGITPDNPETVP